MTQILDHIGKSLHGEFQPTNPDDYFALRLATRLGEPEAAAHYVVLASQYSQEKLICAFRHATGCPKPGIRPSRAFHEFLAKQEGSDKLSRPRFMAVRVERRAVAVAVFAGTHLEGRRVLQLSSKAERAETSAAYFIRSVLREADCKLTGIEPAPAQDEILRAIVHRTVVAQIRNANLSLWEISTKTLFSALSHPPCQSRQQLRDIMLAIWRFPNLKETQLCALDAMALGLFVQTERLFNNF